MASHRAATPTNKKKRWTAEDRKSRAQSEKVREAVRVSRVSRGRKRDLADVESDRESARSGGRRDDRGRPTREDREERLARDLGVSGERRGKGFGKAYAKGKPGSGQGSRATGRVARPTVARDLESAFEGSSRRDEGRGFGQKRSESRGRDDRRFGGRDERSRRFEDRGERRYDREDRRDERSYDRRDDHRAERRFDRRDDERPRRFEDRGGRRFEGRDDRRADRRRSFGDDRRGFARRDDRRDFDERPDKDEMDWAPTTVEAGGDATGPFAALGVPAELVAALDRQGITEPFPIQAATIPDAMSGRDVLGRGQTGSGKTVAFGVPMLTRLAAEPGELRPRALILVPTRELALQVADALSPLAAAVNLSLVLVAGGMSYEPQLKAFRRGVDVIVATPGRIIDHLESGNVDLGGVQVAVLDEADLMGDMGFTPAVRQLLDATPADGQRLLFSATLDEAVDHLVTQYLHDPIVHEVDPDAAAVSTMTHHVFHVHGADKAIVAAQIANRPGRTIVFVRTQKGADRVAGEFLEQGVMAAALHGGLTQGARARVLAAFRAGSIPVLVATDVAARGIHVDDVSLVMQLDPPADSKDYLHRAGRTARAGADGQVVTITQPRQRKTVDRLLREAGVDVTPRRLRPADVDEIEELTGGVAPTGEPIDPARVAELTAPKQGPGRGKKRGWRGQADRDNRRGKGGFRGQRHHD